MPSAPGPTRDQISSCCSSLHRLTCRWPHLASPAHVSIHLCEGRLSVACQPGFIGHQIKPAVIWYPHAVPGRSGTIWQRFRWTAPAWRTLWQFAVESDTWKVIHGMQVVAWKSKKKSPAFFLQGSKTRQKHARNSRANKVKLSFNFNTFQLKQKLPHHALSRSLEKAKQKKKPHIKIW